MNEGAQRSAEASRLRRAWRCQRGAAFVELLIVSLPVFTFFLCLLQLALLFTVVLAIRAENGPNLPVVYLGKELARTDPDGVAHVVLELPPGETASVKLDTTTAPALKPQNPS